MIQTPEKVLDALLVKFVEAMQLIEVYVARGDLEVSAGDRPVEAQVPIEIGLRHEFQRLFEGSKPYEITDSHQKAQFGKLGDYDSVLVIDPLDGTRNMVSGLPFGLNVAWGRVNGRTREEFTIGDLEVALVGDYLRGVVAAWTKGRGMLYARVTRDWKLVDWVRHNADPLVYEVPDEHSHILAHPKGAARQRRLLEVFRELFPSDKYQRRAVDSTGLRMAGVATTELAAYGDVRSVNRLWDTVPSAVLVLHANTRPLTIGTRTLSKISEKTWIVRNWGGRIELNDDLGDGLVVLPTDKFFEFRKDLGGLRRLETDTV